MSQEIKQFSNRISKRNSSKRMCETPDEPSSIPRIPLLNENQDNSEKDAFSEQIEKDSFEDMEDADDGIDNDIEEFPAPIPPFPPPI
jgi:hypothetical protein